MLHQAEICWGNLKLDLFLLNVIAWDLVPFHTEPITQKEFFKQRCASLGAELYILMQNKKVVTFTLSCLMDTRPFEMLFCLHCI
ncbi:hypothetical protein O6H91_21G067300 [Diphasiastrum complanatum]|uniref:Uncharacterized protein n=1 Tax=Diphasiastrum complanatum TaxID=34168 RepID=A0ACC2ALG8_DIPCM|nr:hypothetical protein O6H91_21G067300 [Diphasiastrum complanatum]